MTRRFPVRAPRTLRTIFTACTVAILLTASVVPAAAATLTLTWASNPEPDIAGYIVFYGTSSGSYTGSFNVGNSTSFQFAEPNPSIRYYFAVAAYNEAGLRSAMSTEVSTNPASTPTVLALTSLSANLASPQPVGTSIRFTASATGGASPYQYKWLISDGGTWVVAQEWSTANTFTWTPAAASASYSIGVWVRSAGSTIDAAENSNAGGSMSFAITGGSSGVAVTSLTANKPTPQAAGSKILFTAGASGASAYEFKWWVFDGTAWTIVQEWSGSNKFMWAPTAANADYQILVRAQDASNPSESAGASKPFPIVASSGKGRK
jgi:cell wall-associated protease